MHPSRAGARRRMDGGESFLLREERASARGRKFRRRRCESGDQGAAVLRPDQARKRPCGPRAEQNLKEKTWRTSSVGHKNLGIPGEEKENLTHGKDGAMTDCPGR